MSSTVGFISVKVIAPTVSADTVLPVIVSSESQNYSTQMDTVSGGCLQFEGVPCANDYVVSCQVDGKSGLQEKVVVKYLEITEVTLTVM